MKEHSRPLCRVEHARKVQECYVWKQIKWSPLSTTMADASFQFFNSTMSLTLLHYHYHFLNTASSLSFSLTFPSSRFPFRFSLPSSNPNASPWETPFLMLPWTLFKSASCLRTSASSLSPLCFWCCCLSIFTLFDFDLYVAVLFIDWFIGLFLFLLLWFGLFCVYCWSIVVLWGRGEVGLDLDSWLLDA